MNSLRPSNATGALKARSVKSLKGRRKPSAVPNDPRHSASPKSSQVFHGDKRLLSTAALQRLQDNLEIIRSSATAVAHALNEQNCDADSDAATMLRHHVADALTQQVKEIGIMIQGDAS